MKKKIMTVILLIVAAALVGVLSIFSSPEAPAFLISISALARDGAGIAVFSNSWLKAGSSPAE